MLIQQQPIKRDLNISYIKEAFRNSNIDIENMTIRSVSDSNNTILVQTDDLEYVIMTLTLEQQRDQTLFMTNHFVSRTYNCKYWEDTQEAGAFPPNSPKDLLNWLDVVTYHLKMTHPEQEWTDSILGVCGEEQLLLVYDEFRKQVMEVPFLMQDEELYINGLPISYWDWMKN